MKFYEFADKHLKIDVMIAMSVKSIRESHKDSNEIMKVTNDLFIIFYFKFVLKK
jgi:hypothetical protein